MTERDCLFETEDGCDGCTWRGDFNDCPPKGIRFTPLQRNPEDLFPHPTGMKVKRILWDDNRALATEVTALTEYEIFTPSTIWGFSSITKSAKVYGKFLQLSVETDGTLRVLYSLMEA